MNNSEKENSREQIRERYRSTDNELLEVIPGEKQADFYDDTPRRVAVYVRVSTDSLQQTSSYELQKNYYEEKVKKNNHWTLVDIYADEGISGTSLKHRDEFHRMIVDCKAGKIDMIITKSVSRFARNIVDCITIVRELAALSTPVGVFFETENIYTLNDRTEMSLSFVATMAQEESHIKSSIMNASIEMRFGRGILLTPILLGYDHDEDGKLTVNEKEARTVRLIFFMYLYGYSCQDIAQNLTTLERKTKKGNTVWNPGSVLGILRNERYCGEVLTRKTFTPSYLDHKSKKNTGQRTQHLYKGTHEPIISKDDFIAVQHLLDNAKYGYKGLLPELHIITAGHLQGYITVNPRWSGFKPNDYLSLCMSIYNNEDLKDYREKALSLTSGCFDFRGFEVARSQFFGNTSALTVTLSMSKLKFSAACISKFKNNSYIEILIHPLKKSLAIHSIDGNDRNAFKWSKIDETGNYHAIYVSGTAFISTFYSMFGWDSRNKYRANGSKQRYNDQDYIVFDLNEPEMLISDIYNNECSLMLTGKLPIAYPSEWGENFGMIYYEQDNSTNDQSDMQNYTRTISYSEYRNLKISQPEQIELSIKDMISDMEKEIQNG